MARSKFLLFCQLINILKFPQGIQYRCLESCSRRLKNVLISLIFSKRYCQVKDGLEPFVDSIKTGNLPEYLF